MEGSKDMIDGDTIISFTILIILALIIYTRYQQQTMVDTIRGIKEAIQELKGGGDEWEVDVR